MSAVDELFQDLRSRGRKALMPFVTAGDPDLEFTAQLVRQLARHGGSLCELGIPYSDPIADGPVIQASYTRALQNHITLDQILQMLRSSLSDVAAPLVAMISYAIVYRHGVEPFVVRARESGLAGAIVPDLPVDESSQMLEACRRHDFSLIQLVTPTTPRERAVRIAEASSGFLYYVAVAGITGERSELPPQLVDQVEWLRERTPLPICIGFGISQPAQVRMLAPVADGIIVGSALVRRIAQVQSAGKDKVLADVGQFVEQLAEALQ